jgi:hypothetical protein
MTVADYYGRPVQVGDVITSVGWSPGGFPLWLTSERLTVTHLGRTRVEVTGSGFVGSVRVLAECASIIERDGEPFETDRTAWHRWRFVNPA